MAPLRSAVAMVWAETGVSLRRAWIALWLVGAAFLGLGVWGDHTGFWADKPYLTNTFSALTGAMFGIPVALVIIARLAAAESDASEGRAARRMAVRVSADLAAAVAAVAPAGVSGLRAARSDLQDQRDALLPDGNYWRSPVNLPHYQPFIDAIGSAQDRVDELFGPDVRTHLAEVAVQWSMLLTDVRARLLGSGNSWLPAIKAEELSALTTVTCGDFLSRWRGQGRELQDLYHQEDSRPPAASRAQAFGDLDTLRDFDHWYAAIARYIDAVLELTAKSQAVAQAFAPAGPALSSRAKSAGQAVEDGGGG